VVGDAVVAAAEDQDLDELVEDDAVGDALAVAAKGWWTWRVGSSAATWSQRGSRLQDGIAGTRLHVITWCESLVIITARACPVPPPPYWHRP
jgi:hypothetical protein